MVLAKKRTESAKLKIYWWLSLTVVAIWAIGFITGSRVPYIYTDLAFKVRAFVVFPILLCTLGYFSFQYKNEKSGWKTGYSIAMNSFKTRAEKVKATLWGVAGLFLLPAGFAWTTTAFSAWAAVLTASTPFSQTYTVKEINELSGPVWSTLFDLTLVRDGAEAGDLRLNRRRYDAHHWKAGDVICVRGRTSVFGSIADTVAKGSC